MGRLAGFRCLLLHDRRREEIDRHHQAVVLRFECTELSAFGNICEPIRVGPEVLPFRFSVTGVLIRPDVDILVGIARLRRHIEQRLAEISALRLRAHLGVKLKVFFDRAGLASIGPNIEQHNISP